MIAIKRSQHGSMQGSREFKNEVELLSRVHHKNLVKLVGFCFDKGEQTLVYEFIPNGTLMESLSGSLFSFTHGTMKITVMPLFQFSCRTYINILPLQLYVQESLGFEWTG